jgi:hypothetical protein
MDVGMDVVSGAYSDQLHSCIICIAGTTMGQAGRTKETTAGDTDKSRVGAGVDLVAFSSLSQG